MTLLLLFQAPVPVPPISDPSNFTAGYEALVPGWIAAVYPYAGELFAALAFLDLAVFGWTLIRKHGVHDLPGIIFSSTHRLVLIGAFLALLMNGSSWMGYIIQMFIQVGKAGSGVSAIQPSVILQRGVDIGFALLGQSALSGVLQGPVVAFAFILAAFLIPLSFLIITIDFVVTKIQSFLALGMGFFFLGFGGSGWTRNYVERYFSYAMSTGVRLMAQYFLIGTGLILSSNWLSQAKNAPWSVDGVKQAWLVMFGSILYAVLCWRGSAVAAQLLGGGPNLSHSETFQAMGTAVQAGVAAALVASGIGSAAGAALGGGSAATAAGSSGAGAAKGAASSAGGGSAGAGSTPTSKPPASSGSNGIGGGQRAYQAANAVAGALHGVGGGGTHQVQPPAFKGLSE